MFWKNSWLHSSNTTKKQKSPDKTVTKTGSHKSRGFHSDPTKSWSYYGETAQAEREDLMIVAKKHNTASTEESNLWTHTLAQLMTEQREQDTFMSRGEDGEEENVGEQDHLRPCQEENEYYYTPEGVTRTPFASWEVDLLVTSRHSSYFQRDQTLKKLFFISRPHHTYTNTPSNSPRPGTI